MSDIIFDLQGVLYNGKTPNDGAKAVFNEMRKERSIVVISNSSTFTSDEVGNMMKSDGFDVDGVKIVTGLTMTDELVRSKKYKKVFCLSTKSFSDSLAKTVNVVRFEDHEGEKAEKIKLIDGVEAVIVAEDKDFEFTRISVATRYVMEKGAQLFVVGGDRVFPTDNGNFTPGGLPLVAAAETASYKKATVIGKPNKETVVGLEKNRSYVVVGDNQETDIRFANEMGFKSVLVLTGITSESEVKNDDKPTKVCHKISDLPSILKEL